MHIDLSSDSLDIYHWQQETKVMLDIKLFVAHFIGEKEYIQI
jgi:hypothetical protein